MQPDRQTILGRWQSWPLYGRIGIAVVLGVVVGLLLGPNAASLAIPSKLVLRLLGALAPPLILVAVVHVLLNAQIHGRQGARLVSLLLINTLVAISIGLLVANVVRPGEWTDFEQPIHQEGAEKSLQELLALFLDNIPKSLFGPLGDDGKVIGVILIAVAFGIALRRVHLRHMPMVNDALDVLLSTLIVMIHWLIEVVPLAVFGIVASIIGVKGFGDFIALGAFVLAVLLALALQATYYLLRIRFGSWVRPLDLLRHGRDALVMAFSTGSSTVTMPLTYACLKDRVGLREQSASMGSLVGANFNNDGTALYEAMSALFVSQLLGKHLSLAQQLMVVLTSVIASVGAAGIPEAGLVTMTLVFNAVGLPVEYIAILLTVDWFLDRCRTAINVMGDMNVSCLLDGKTRAEPVADVAETPAVVVEPASAETSAAVKHEENS